MNNQPTLIVHGGAGRVEPNRQPACRDGVRAAALAGWAVLSRGGPALEAVEAAVRVLEDDPNFNAGTGATLDAEGAAQLDASIMEGNGLRAGAVAALRRVRNPISLARRVLEDGRHVLLAGDGAERFAQTVGIPLCDPAELVVPRQRRLWEDRHGTVGCAALDRDGKLAAATSTGGRLGSLPGRVGDSPLIGCGTYANEVGAVSCTGHGEVIIRTVLAKTAVDLLAAGLEPRVAALRAVESVQAHTGGDVGLILVNRQGRVGHARNTPRMPVAWVTGTGAPRVEL